MWQNCEEDKFCLCMVCVCVWGGGFDQLSSCSGGARNRKVGILLCAVLVGERLPVLLHFSVYEE